MTSEETILIKHLTAIKNSWIDKNAVNVLYHLVGIGFSEITWKELSYNVEKLIKGEVKETDDDSIPFILLLRKAFNNAITLEVERALVGDIMLKLPNVKIEGIEHVTVETTKLSDLSVWRKYKETFKNPIATCAISILRLLLTKLNNKPTHGIFIKKYINEKLEEFDPEACVYFNERWITDYAFNFPKANTRDQAINTAVSIAMKSDTNQEEFLNINNERSKIFPIADYNQFFISRPFKCSFDDAQYIFNNSLQEESYADNIRVMLLLFRAKFQNLKDNREKVYDKIYAPDKIIQLEKFDSLSSSILNPNLNSFTFLHIVFNGHHEYVMNSHQEKLMIIKKAEDENTYIFMIKKAIFKLIEGRFNEDILTKFVRSFTKLLDNWLSMIKVEEIDKKLVKQILVFLANPITFEIEKYSMSLNFDILYALARELDALLTFEEIKNHIKKASDENI